MDKFEVGQVVKVIREDDSLFGKRGDILAMTMSGDVFVRIDGVGEWFVQHELAPSTAQPAASATAADGRAVCAVTEQDLYEAFFVDKTYGAVKALFDTLQSQVRQGEFYQQMQAERGNDFEAEAADLRAKLASAEAALRPFANQWAEWVKTEWVREEDTRMDIIDFFADYADNDVVAKHLKAAYDALQANG